MCRQGAYINLVPLTSVNGGTVGKPLQHIIAECYVDDMTPKVVVRSAPLVLQHAERSSTLDGVLAARNQPIDHKVILLSRSLQKAAAPPPNNSHNDITDSFVLFLLHPERMLPVPWYC